MTSTTPGICRGGVCTLVQNVIYILYLHISPIIIYHIQDIQKSPSRSSPNGMAGDQLTPDQHCSENNLRWKSFKNSRSWVCQRNWLLDKKKKKEETSKRTWSPSKKLSPMMITVPPPVVQPSLQTESLVIYLSLLVLPLSYDDQKKECYKRDFYDPMQCSPWRDCLDARYCSCWVEAGVESWVAWTYFLCNACTNAQYSILNAFNASTQYCKHYKANKIMFFLEKKKIAMTLFVANLQL